MSEQFRNLVRRTTRLNPGPTPIQQDLFNLPPAIKITGTRPKERELAEPSAPVLTIKPVRPPPPIPSRLSDQPILVVEQPGIGSEPILDTGIPGLLDLGAKVLTPQYIVDTTSYRESYILPDDSPPPPYSQVGNSPDTPPFTSEFARTLALNSPRGTPGASAQQRQLVLRPARLVSVSREPVLNHEVPSILEQGQMSARDIEITTMETPAPQAASTLIRRSRSTPGSPVRNRMPWNRQRREDDDTPGAGSRDVRPRNIMVLDQQETAFYPPPNRNTAPTVSGIQPLQSQQPQSQDVTENQNQFSKTPVPLPRKTATTIGESRPFPTTRISSLPQNVGIEYSKQQAVLNIEIIKNHRKRLQTTIDNIDKGISVRGEEERRQYALEIRDLDTLISELIQTNMPENFRARTLKSTSFTKRKERGRSVSRSLNEYDGPYTDDEWWEKGYFSPPIRRKTSPPRYGGRGDHSKQEISDNDSFKWDLPHYSPPGPPNPNSGPNPNPNPGPSNPGGRGGNYQDTGKLHDIFYNVVKPISTLLDKESRHDDHLLRQGYHHLDSIYPSTVDQALRNEDVVREQGSKLNNITDELTRLKSKLSRLEMENHYSKSSKMSNISKANMLRPPPLSSYPMELQRATDDVYLKAISTLNSSTKTLEKSLSFKENSYNYVLEVLGSSNGIALNYGLSRSQHKSLILNMIPPTSTIYMELQLLSSLEEIFELISVNCTTLLTRTEIEEKIEKWTIDSSTVESICSSLSALKKLVFMHMDTSFDQVDQKILYQTLVQRIRREKLPAYMMNKLEEARALMSRENEPVVLHNILISTLKHLVGYAPRTLKVHKQEIPDMVHNTTYPMSFVTDYMPPSVSYAGVSQHAPNLLALPDLYTKQMSTSTENQGQSNPPNKDEKQISQGNQNKQKAKRNNWQQERDNAKGNKTNNNKKENGNKNNNQNGKNWQGTPKTYFLEPWPKNKTYRNASGNKLSPEVESYFQGHCYKCGHNSHRARECRTYPERVSVLSICTKCGCGFHTVCKRRNSGDYQATSYPQTTRNNMQGSPNPNQNLVSNGIYYPRTDYSRNDYPHPPPGQIWTNGFPTPPLMSGYGGYPGFPGTYPSSSQNSAPSTRASTPGFPQQWSNPHARIVNAERATSDTDE
jgi:hypothetical protein